MGRLAVGSAGVLLVLFASCNGTSWTHTDEAAALELAPTVRVCERKGIIFVVQMQPPWLGWFRDMGCMTDTEFRMAL